MSLNVATVPLDALPLDHAGRDRERAVREDVGLGDGARVGGGIENPGSLFSKKVVLTVKVPSSA